MRGRKLAPGALLPKDGWDAYLFDQRLYDLHNGGASLRGDCWFCFCFLGESGGRVGSVFLILISVLLTNCLAHVAFPRSLSFPPDNDLRREPQGPVQRRKHLYKGRGWKQQIGFFHDL